MANRLTVPIRRALIGGRVQLPTGELAVVRGINSEGTARVSILGMTGLDSLRDVHQDTLQSVPWNELVGEGGSRMICLGEIE